MFINPKENKDKLLELISEFNKVDGYKSQYTKINSMFTN